MDTFRSDSSLAGIFSYSLSVLWFFGIEPSHKAYWLHSYKDFSVLAPQTTLMQHVKENDSCLNYLMRDSHSRHEHIKKNPKGTRMEDFIIMERCLTLLITYLVSLLLKFDQLNVNFPNPWHSQVQRFTFEQLQYLSKVPIKNIKSFSLILIFRVR